MVCEESCEDAGTTKVAENVLLPPTVTVEGEVTKGDPSSVNVIVRPLIQLEPPPLLDPVSVTVEPTLGVLSLIPRFAVAKALFGEKGSSVRAMATIDKLRTIALFIISLSVMVLYL